MKFAPSKTIALGAVAGLIFIFALVASFYGGFTYGEKQPRLVQLSIGNATTSEGGSSEADFNIFWQAWNLIRAKALKGGEVSDKTMIYGAIRGLVDSLGDPHSVFFTPEDGKQFNDDISGTFSGVGLEIGKKDGNLVVIAPLKGTPADQAGLRPDDQILKIDDTYTTDMEVDQAVKLIRGAEGTTVTLLMFREGWDQAKIFPLKRQKIDIPTVEFSMKNKDIAYIKLNTFNEKAPQLFYTALNDASNKGARGIILDLRNDPGGYLEVAVDLAGYFLDKNTLVVSEKYRTGQTDEFKSRGNGDLKNIPVVVLVNGGSASASEILAGALHDQNKTKLIGEKTFGKGTVQIVENLTDGAEVKLTVANWVLPSGVIIEKNGIAPDIEVKISDDDRKAGKDPQLDKAIEEVTKELK